MPVRLFACLAFYPLSCLHVYVGLLFCLPCIIEFSMCLLVASHASQPNFLSSAAVIIRVLLRRCWSLYSVLNSLLINVAVVNDQLHKAENAGAVLDATSIFTLRLFVTLLGPVVTVNVDCYKT